MINLAHSPAARNARHADGAYGDDGKHRASTRTEHHESQVCTVATSCGRVDDLTMPGGSVGERDRPRAGRAGHTYISIHMPPNFPAGTTRRDFTRNRVKKPKIYRRYAPEPCKWCKKAQNCPAGYAPRERFTAPDFPAQIKCGSTAFFPHLAHEVWPLFGVCATTILSH
jgi:hypothetical protein